jgi:succinate dehydrogenase / fumarate reductase cytochrome b subunit
LTLFLPRHRAMHLLPNLFRTTIGRKFLMALSGVVLIAFIIGHLVGNLQIFEDPDKINGYSFFLHSLGPTLYVVRAVLLLCVVIHIWAGTTLAIEDRAARGPVAYRRNRWLQAFWASRYMRWTGYVVLAFVLYHLAQFTWGVAQAGTFKEHLSLYTMTSDYKVLGLTAVRAGTPVLDVRSMVIRGFQPAGVALFYIFAIGLLTVHLLHGADSLFQTFGWRNTGWAGGLRAVVTLGCLAYFLGNLLIPGAVLTGYLHG